METRIEVPFDSRLLFTEDLLALSMPESPAAKAYEIVARKIDGLSAEMIRIQEKIELRMSKYLQIYMITTIHT